MSRQKKRTHHSKPHGGALSYAQALNRQRAVAAALDEEAHRIAADQQAQRMLWLAVITLADAFGIGPERLQKRFFPTLQANADELGRMVAEGGEVYAWEKLRSRAEEVSGVEIHHFCEMNPVYMLRNEERANERSGSNG